MSLNNEPAAMMVFETNPVGVELFSCVNAFFFPINLHDTGHLREDALYVVIDEKGGGGVGVFFLLHDIKSTSMRLID